MKSIPGFLLLALGIGVAGSIILSAQEKSPAEVMSESPLPLVPSASFYHPPVIREVWDNLYRRLDDMEDGLLTKKFVRALLDSLAVSVQADFDSLAIRAPAIETS